METLNRLLKYNNWANQLLIASFKDMGALLPNKCIHLLSHIVNTQSVWLSRLNGTTQSFGAWDEHTIATCEIIHNESSAMLEQQILLPAEKLSEIIEYVNSTGKTFHTSRYDILIHILNHSTYHRAQIASQYRLNSLEPINTDYINYVR
jgi:uncharacterized damage-inducible protein DinB